MDTPATQQRCFMVEWHNRGISDYAKILLLLLKLHCADFGRAHPRTVYLAGSGTYEERCVGLSY